MRLGEWETGFLCSAGEPDPVLERYASARAGFVKELVCLPIGYRSEARYSLAAGAGWLSRVFSVVAGLGWASERLRVGNIMLLSVLLDNNITYTVTFRDMSLHVFSYQPFVGVLETPNLHDHKATDSQIEIVLRSQLAAWKDCVVA